VPTPRAVNPRIQSLLPINAFRKAWVSPSVCVLSTAAMEALPPDSASLGCTRDRFPRFRPAQRHWRDKCSETETRRYDQDQPPHGFNQDTEAEWRQCLADARRCADQSKP
jgi:hypothetical protein